MPLYLIHQKRDGTPVGVYNETSHYYFPGNDALQRYGVATMKTRGSLRAWEDWVDTLASSTPKPTSKWTAVDLPQDTLPNILSKVRDSAIKPVADLKE